MTESNVDSFSSEGVTPYGDEVRRFWNHIKHPNRLRVLVTACCGFSTKGYASTSTRWIADQAGLSAAAIYSLFESKEDLLYEIVLNAHQEVLKEVRRAARQSDSPTAQLRSMVYVSTLWHAENRLIAKIAQREFLELREEFLRIIHALRQHFTQEFHEVINRGIARRDFDVKDTRVLARYIINASIDVCRWFDPSRSSTPQEVAMDYTNIAEKLLTAGAIGKACPVEHMIANPWKEESH